MVQAPNGWDTSNMNDFKFYHKDVAFSQKSNEWTTPQWLFDVLHGIFDFTVDAAANSKNSKLPVFFKDGLTTTWRNERVFCNPPYSRKDIIRWTEKFKQERNNAQLIVGLIPARTETKWFFNNVWSVVDTLCFIRGRLKFGEQGINAAPFPSCLAIYISDTLIALPYEYNYSEEYMIEELSKIGYIIQE